jgi:hypothetical protein
MIVSTIHVSRGIRLRPVQDTGGKRRGTSLYLANHRRPLDPRAGRRARVGPAGFALPAAKSGRSVPQGSASDNPGKAARYHRHVHSPAGQRHLRTLMGLRDHQSDGTLSAASFFKRDAGPIGFAAGFEGWRPAGREGGTIGSSLGKDHPDQRRCAWTGRGRSAAIRRRGRVDREYLRRRRLTCFPGAIAYSATK